MKRALALAVLIPAVWMMAGVGIAQVRERGTSADDIAGSGGFRNSPTTADYAFLEFAPADGAGMGVACSGTTPTGAKGEALTFTRASAATCLRGNTTTGIANGDLVKLTSGQPRVMPGGDGTGGLGLLVEGARTNDALRSEEFDNAAVWAPTGTVPTVTADFAVAPDGTTTAERVQFAATTGANLSLLSQTALASGIRTGSVFIRGNGTSGALDIYQSGTSLACGGCPFTATSWTRCVLPGTTAVTTLQIGNDSLDCGSAARSAVDVFVWGGQSEVGTFASSYISTVGTAVTRVLEIASIDLGASFVLRSIAVTTTGPALSDVPAFGTPITANATVSDGNPPLLAYYAGSNVTRCWRSADVSAGSSVGLLAGPLRSWCASSTALSNRGQFGANATSPSTTGDPVAARFIRFGDFDTANAATVFGVHKQVCADPASDRCR